MGCKIFLLGVGDRGKPYRFLLIHGLRYPQGTQEPIPCGFQGTPISQLEMYCIITAMIQQWCDARMAVLPFGSFVPLIPTVLATENSPEVGLAFCGLCWHCWCSLCCVNAPSRSCCPKCSKTPFHPLGKSPAVLLRFGHTRIALLVNWGLTCSVWVLPLAWLLSIINSPPFWIGSDLTPGSVPKSGKSPFSNGAGWIVWF